MPLFFTFWVRFTGAVLRSGVFVDTVLDDKDFVVCETVPLVFSCADVSLFNASSSLSISALALSKTALRESSLRLVSE